MKAEERPEKVIFLIVTDGQENSSREFNRAQITQMISAHEEKEKWQFVYISADLAAIEDAHQYGVRAGKMMAFDKTAQGTADAFMSVSQKTRQYRSNPAPAASMEFDEEDRGKQEAEKQRKR